MGRVTRTFGSGVFGAVLAGLATPLVAERASICDRLDQAMVAVENDDAKAQAVTALLAGFGPAQAACSFSLDLSGAKSANCNWSFSYRSDAAATGFREMLAEVSTCADPAFAISADQPVNHPDFYDLRLLRIMDGEVGLSLKDKVSLQQTYVFLRLTPTVKD